MSWEDRLIEAAYTSPSGKRFTFIYEDVSSDFDKKGSFFDFPDANGTYVQQLGNTSRRYPLLCIFSGADYDLQSEAFLKGLEENGVGKLEHPIYGIVDALPLGTIKRRDDLKTAGNQSIIEVSFLNTIGIIYPSSQNNAGSLVISSVEEYNKVSSTSFGDLIDLNSATKIATFKNKFSSTLSSVTSSLEPLTTSTQEVQTEFNSINSSINNGLKNLVNDPTTLASQVNQLIQSPSRAFTSITSKLNSFQGLLNSSISNNATDSNDYYTNKLYSENYISGSILSVVNNDFETKKDALESAELVLEQLDSLNTWNDTQLDNLNEIDTGESYQKIQESVALTAGFLVEISFSLKQERSIVLDRNRTIIDLCSELYSNVDDELDFLINSNNLSGSEILELPKGKEILYYV